MNAWQGGDSEPVGGGSGGGLGQQGLGSSLSKCLQGVLPGSSVVKGESLPFQGLFHPEAGGC